MTAAAESTIHDPTSQSAVAGGPVVRGLSALRWIWLSLGVLQGLLLLRYCFASISSPLETGYFEAKMIYLSQLARDGKELYPDWHLGPYESNFFGPLYFLVVGGVGRWWETGGFESLVPIGRWLSLAGAWSTSLWVGLFLRRRLDLASAYVGALFTWGSAPLIVFSVMNRPDTTANSLGSAGMLLCLSGGWQRTVIGAAVLLAAGFTKQTAGAYLLAAAAGMAACGRRKEAIVLLLGCMGAGIGIVWLLSAGVWPHFLESLLGEGGTEFRPADWLAMLARLARRAPLLIFAVGAGGWLWMRRPRQADLAAASLVLTLFCAVTAGKLGSDLNYFLPMTVVGGLACGCLWRSTSDAVATGRIVRTSAVVCIAAIACTAIGVWDALEQSNRAVRLREFLASPAGKAYWNEYQGLFARAADPSTRMLTDSGLLALHQRGRAPFIDPCLYRMLSMSGRVDPQLLVADILSGRYNLVVLTVDVKSTTYDEYPFGLPPVVADAVRRRFRKAGVSAGLHVYVLNDAGPLF
jgi:hypothetical protein